MVINKRLLGKVAVIKTRPKTVLEDIEKVMLDAKFDRALKRDKTTILKDNISWHMPYLSANTTPWQLEGVAKTLLKYGYKDLVSVHNNTVVTNPFKGQKLNKLDKIYKRYNITELYNFSKDFEWIRYRPKFDTLALHKVYGDNIRIPKYFIGKNIIHLPTVKCHIYTTTTGAMKNAFGGLLNTKRHYTHSWIHETLVDLLRIQQDIHAGIFTVMDGTLAGNGPGPRTMIPVEKDMMLAAYDSVAIDAVAAKMMGFDPMKIKYIKLAHDLGIGIGDIKQIDVIGYDISGENWHFRVGDNLASMVGDIMWFGPLKKLQKMFFHTPLVYIFVFGSFFYHDYIWWPLKGKKIQNEIRKKNKWGKLFESY